ncbi:MAG: carboxypeptidase-like regulatory domain-containing protein [Planctomycetaceae bacterium]|jgi:hypothetical protein|nr:carboxypeptidase-like regulatory domain-containing protein [Planctomycetaceae bacterium]
MLSKIYFFLCVLFLALNFLTGCKKAPQPPADMPKLESCRITIMLAGQPLPEAIVALKPTEPTQYHSGGSTNVNGSFEVFTNGLYKGIPAGKYKVTVKKEIPTPTPEGISQEELMDPVKSAKYRQPPTIVVHKKYHLAETTPLEIEVLPNVPLNVTLQVESP